LGCLKIGAPPPPPKPTPKKKKKLVKFTIDQKENPKISLFFWLEKQQFFLGKKKH
jgi:hypothetical protein